MVEILSARPPTPPRTVSSRIVLDETNQTASPLAVQTPKGSPFTALGSTEPGLSNRSSKRVNFSPWPKYIKPPTFASASKAADDVKTIPSSTDLKPAKSILKATQSPIPVWSPNVDTFTADSLAMLLESVIQQLAGESMSSRLDAYMQFFGALRTYDGLPAGQEIAEKLNLITEFIQRDVSRDLANAGPHVINLVNQALKLSAAFVWHPQISTKLPDEFKIFLIEHSITCLHEAKAPKSVLSHYMSIISTQNFGPKVMTTARVTRLLTVLSDITQNISGNAIVSHRLNIYQRLLSQAKPAFISQANLWIEHLIFGLLHNVKDTREKAIVLGFQVAADAGSSPILAKSIRDLFDRPLEHDRKLVMEVRERMARMMSTTDSGVHVPQIWSIIILLLRNKKWNVEHWDHFKEWVLVLQKCFNCSEPAIKAQAIIAWNRFVFAVGPNESTSRSLLKMLGKPVFSQFDRKKSDKSGSPPSQLALNSYYNLLYYTFRTSASYQHLDLIWEEFVLIPSSGIFSSMPVLGDCLSNIVSNLLWTTHVKVWTESRINDTNKMEADELPTADSRWVRSRISPILKVFENLFKSSVWVNDAIGTSNVALAWNSLCNALSLASSKEITPSGESMQAVASVLALLHRLWVAGPSSLNADSPDVFFKRFQYLSTTMIVSIGGIPFTEKLLLRTADETFVTASSPSHRHPQPGTNLDSPILHLLRSISSIAGTISPSESYTRLVMGIIEAACNSKISRGSRLELLQQCAELSTAETSAIPRAPSLSVLVWNATCQAASNALQSFPLESARARDGSVSRDYDNVIKILSFGLLFPSAFQAWSHLLESFVRVLRTEKGNQAIATMIIEPMADRLMHLPAGDTLLPSTSLFSHSLSIPFLQGTGLGIDPEGIQSLGHTVFPHKFLESITRTMHDAYDEFSKFQVYDLAEFIEGLTSFLGSGAPQFQCQVLQSLQSSLSFWLRDEAYKVNVERGVDGRILTACGALSSAALHVLQTSVSHDLPSSKSFETILCAGLESSNINTVKKFVEFWGLTFGLVKSSAYPTTLLQAVQTAESRLQSAAFPPQNGHQDIDMVSPPPQDSTDQPMNGIPQLALSSCGTQPNSPLTASSKLLEQVTEPQLPSNFQSEYTDVQIDNDISASLKRRSHREIFSMIESIQSSSPGPTPRKLGFNTPPHLRRLQSGESASELLLTPTLAPTEHEEGFIGSSPTPGTRDPTPSMTSDAAVLLPHGIPSSQITDPPSSPPEMHSRSPSPRKGRSRSRGERRKAAKARKALIGNSGQQSTVNSPATSRLATEHNTDTTMEDASDHDQDKENTDSTPRANGTTSRRHLRSALGKDPATVPEPSPGENFDSPGRTPVQKPRTGKPNSSSKKKRKQTSPQPAQKTIQQAIDMPSDSHHESFMDSSEETETQIASQLEQDLELAVDTNDRAQAQRSQPADEPSMKKRKRDEEEVHPPTKNDRRRSTRLSSVKDVVNVEPSEPDGADSQTPTILTSGLSPCKSLSPTATRRSTRNSQRQEASDNTRLGPAAPTQQHSSPRGLTNDDETPRPSKRSRKSHCLESQPVSSPAPKSSRRSSQDTPTRKTRSQKRAIETESESQVHIIPSPEHDIPSDDLRPPNGDLNIVPESVITMESAADQDISPVSTEEATDSQVSQMGQGTKPDLVNAELKMDLDFDLDTRSEAQPTEETVEQTTSLATASTQTHESTPPQYQLDVSEEGITQSLQKILGNMKTATLSPNALREVDDLLFNIRVEAHDASQRHNTSA
ncbi:uncharacterized protein N7529_005856 [Penicillium soppii]|uniref:uncharacterized protein n=1 Tax=Penicillium soppii TaxID=69789 RepID=UPI0025476E29|nr:uncharacterized protein N7529_005856 [Penicillium soppii]KAJ5863940.1 hypothetical protein N7529_005856 [Penicillium soppii]